MWTEEEVGERRAAAMAPAAAAPSGSRAGPRPYGSLLHLDVVWSHRGRPSARCLLRFDARAAVQRLGKRCGQGWGCCFTVAHASSRTRQPVLVGGGVFAALLWDCVSWITHQYRLLSLPTDLSVDARIVVERAREAVGSAWDGFVRRCLSSVELVLEGRCYLKMCRAAGPWQSDGGAAAGALELHTVEWTCGRML